MAGVMLIKKRCNVVLLGFGLFFSLCGFVILFSWSFIFDSLWRKNLALSPDSESHKLWVRTPMPLYIEVYLFNWTNSNEFLRDKMSKPAFAEIGPFVFREVHEKIGVTWNSNDTVTYNQTRTWTFCPEASVSLSTPVTNLNVVVSTIAKAVADKSILVKGIIDFLIYQYKEKLIITRPAGQWLFEGMDDSLLDFIRKSHAAPVPFEKFGWFYGRNGSSTYDGVFNVKRGSKNIYEMGVLDEWNNVDRTNFFGGQCGRITGTTSEIFPPLNKWRTNLTIFISDFCGSFTLARSGSAVINGLEGYRFVGDERVFDNGTKYPEAKCFCNGSCRPSGVRNEASCLKAPAFISFPHFYLADPAFAKSITGMKPNKSEHEFYLTLNPLTGLPLEVRAQLQINLLLEPISSVPMFSSVPELFVPMMWFRQSVKLTEDLASMTTRIAWLFKLGYVIGGCLIAIGALMIGMKMFRRPSNGSNKELLLPSSNE